MFSFSGEVPDGLPPGTVDNLEIEANSVSRSIVCKFVQKNQTHIDPMIHQQHIWVVLDKVAEVLCIVDMKCWRVWKSLMHIYIYICIADCW